MTGLNFDNNAAREVGADGADLREAAIEGDRDEILIDMGKALLVNNMGGLKKFFEKNALADATCEAEGWTATSSEEEGEIMMLAQNKELHDDCFQMLYNMDLFNLHEKSIRSYATRIKEVLVKIGREPTPFEQKLINFGENAGHIGMTRAGESIPVY